MKCPYCKGKKVVTMKVSEIIEATNEVLREGNKEQICPHCYGSGKMNIKNILSWWWFYNAPFSWIK